MNIETVEELAEKLADWLGIYGCCKSNGDEGCEYDKENPFCCRHGLTGALVERMTAAITNSQMIQYKEEVNLIAERLQRVQLPVPDVWDSNFG